MIVRRLVRTCSALLVSGALSSACNLVGLPGADTDGTDTDGTTAEPAPSTGDAPTTGDVPTTGPNDPSGGTPSDCDFEGAVQAIFTASCSCHAGGQPAAGLSLAAGESYAALVGVESSQSPGSLRVAPGSPESSFLVEKLSPGPSVGQQMPIGGSLSVGQIATITAWIAAGAPETEVFACAPGQQGGDVGEVEIDVDGPLQVQVGETLPVTALVSDPDGEPVEATLTWKSSAELTLYVDGQGVLLGVSPGTVELTASAGGVTSAAVAVEVVDHDPPAATFTQVRAITDARCAVAGCHVDGVEPGDLRFDREPDKLWEELVEDEAEQVNMPRVAANAPTDSYLMHKLVLTAPAVGGRMPFGGPPIAAEEAQVILRWILAGAQFN
ncbi:Ig-like domain-containing protein [Nannocystis punicea]|uniref:Ig-like domain-containing protein n=1 Tax=Nannocystis punicea TaxID=2995304 RepID=A0ABY7H219_9BACT|nr:Ig-like domain-containing protein [Nannocystis poenicansa]WAS93170.1 Ig-like domain-containing protein [Nannocystis poenicansa]